MRTPKFWYGQKISILSLLLTPVSWIYALTHATLLGIAKPWQSPIPVICVGNLTVGGHGKTPTALSICHILKSYNKSVHFISRGYKGSLNGPILVNPSSHSAIEVGDEPLLLSEIAPTWVSANREAGIRLAHKMGAEIIIMDDGFQNPSIKKDLSIIVIDGEVGFGNGHLIPAGPLREGINAGLSRANAVVIIGEDKKNLKSTILEINSYRSQKPFQVLTSRLEPDVGSNSFGKKKVLAFTGISRPEKFFNTLIKLGYDIVVKKSFPDHHQYTKKELANLHKTAQIENVQLITTSKDYVRLTMSQQKGISVLPVKIDWGNKVVLDSLLRSVI
jgi:tetraacyldisaccharide 4'-kinase